MSKKKERFDWHFQRGSLWLRWYHAAWPLATPLENKDGCLLMWGILLSPIGFVFRRVTLGVIALIILVLVIVASYDQRIKRGSKRFWQFIVAAFHVIKNKTCPVIRIDG